MSSFASNDEIKFRLNILGMDEKFLDADLYVIKLDRLKKIFSESALTKIESFHQKEIPKNNSAHQIGARTNFISEAEEKFDNIADLYEEVEPHDLFSNEKNIDENDFYEFNKESNQYEKVTTIRKLSNLSNNLSNNHNNNLSNNIESINKTIQISQSEIKNYEIFSNCQSEQLDKLEKIIKEMNSSKKDKICVKAYRSKMKSRFCKLYEHNSKITAEKTKYKIFHKCKFPNCSRTFASSGWLKSHFSEHISELKENQFNKEFEKRLNLISK